MEDHRRGGGGGGGGVTKKKRKNKRRHNPRKHNQQQNHHPGSRGPPLTPVLKVTIRKIGSLHGEDAGSVSSMIRGLICSANEKLSVLDPKMVLDELYLKQLIDDENVAAVAAQKWKEEKEKVANVNGELKEDEVEGVVDTKAMDEGKGVYVGKFNSAPDSLAEAMDKNLQLSDEINFKNQIVARVLYIVPPKKTRRRGEKPGTVYLILTAPPIERLAPVVEPAAEWINDSETVASQSTVAASVTSSSAAVTPPPPAVDYSRDVAKRRLMLQHALEAMQDVVAVDAVNNVDSVMVEESISAKSWKQSIRSRAPMDRMAGTIFETEDYQQFLSKTLKDEEQRRTRPRPTPGGGMASANGAGTDSSGQPVAALVLHMQLKQEEEKKRKQAKRKAKDSKKKKSGPAEGNVTAVIGSGGEKDANKKRCRRPKKKRGPNKDKKSDNRKASGAG